MIILGIETSCDETAAAVVTGDREVLADEIRSQWEEHGPYGGVEFLEPNGLGPGVRLREPGD